MNLEERVLRLEAAELARGLLNTYSHVLDDPRPETVAALFAEDAVLTTPSASVRGRAEIQAWYEKAFAADPSRKRHFLVHPRVTWLGDFRVRVESSFLFTGRADRRSVIGWGDYDDVIAVGGEPKFVRKDIVPSLATDLAAGWAL
ncbi:nuclear transport factor 2 family protein [Amycolatopsis acidicola]|uniref:Nuclear transport factor 2 family protein n=1 Tax=Amycolatopsis acidicola TaxID=2596893 RepID=A0A5N0UKL9_9PSEU|nr:nuclear transport factor 2 family protein [Amycolatopsis acidicola]KAA9148629.1 nuclear transport factor 2 family protein [Amycolatopsis acidicola]